MIFLILSLFLILCMKHGSCLEYGLFGSFFRFMLYCSHFSRSIYIPFTSPQTNKHTHSTYPPMSTNQPTNQPIYASRLLTESITPQEKEKRKKFSESVPHQAKPSLSHQSICSRSESPPHFPVPSPKTTPSFPSSLTSLISDSYKQA